MENHVRISYMNHKNTDYKLNAVDYLIEDKSQEEVYKDAIP